jgi:hypothetical protein
MKPLEDHPPAPAVALRCLGGDGAPADLVADALLVASFPKAAQRTFWTLLVPAIVSAPPPEVEGDIEAFARREGLDVDAVSRALRAHRFLLRGAAQHQLDKESYASDLVALAGSELTGRRLFEAIVSGYDLARRALEHEHVSAALTAHGSLLEGVAWRVDEMVLSPDGTLARARVGILTLRYRTGARESRLSLQLLPREIEALERACRAMLGKPDEERP